MEPAVRADRRPVPSPQSWECDALTADGRPVHLRPIRPDDADALVAFHAGLSDATVYYRFFSYHPRLSEREVERFTTVDGHRRVALVALLDERIVAVGRYDRIPATTDAEVAFVVTDEMQGCGLGTLLLEHLAAIGTANGIERFTATVLAGNGRMLRAFRASGFQESSHMSSGTVEVVLPLTSNAATAAAVERREHQAEARSIHRLLHPTSVSVIGASDRPGSVGHALVTNLLAGGFQGEVHAVNPSGRSVAGLPPHRSVLDIVGPVDLAVVAVPAAAVEQVVHDCATKGVPDLVIITAGFAEAGADDAAGHERALVELARRHGMRVVGPNCLGIANTAIGLDATFAPFPARPGNVACLSQSGALGIALLERTTELGLGVSSFVSVGNKADVSGNDLLQHWEDDDRTDVIVLYLESFGNPRKFARIARRVSRTKPIVALKSGRSSAGRRAASSHTAAMASPDAAVDALFAQTGVIRVDTLTDLFDTAALLAWQPLPAGNRVAIVGNSGGPETMACDAAEALGLELAVPTEATLDELRDLLPAGMGAAANPLDLLAGVGPDTLEAAMSVLAADDGVDALVAVVTPVLEPTAEPLATAIARGAAETTKPVLAAVLAVPSPPSPLVEHHIPWYSSPEAALHALARAVRYAAWRRRDPGGVVAHDDVRLGAGRQIVSGEARWLSPGDAGRLLACYGIATVSTQSVLTADEAVRAADRLGYPVVLKTADPDVVHKTDVGAVHLDLVDAAAVRRAADEIDEAVGGAAGYIVQPMVGDGVEMIAGITHDPAFGPLVMVGAGGVNAELLGDRNLHILPLTDVDAAEAIRSLRLSPLLFGYRGRPRVAVDRLEDLLTRLAQMADDLPEIAELDANPILVTPTGAFVADAKIRVAPAPPHLPDTLRHLR
jgi:acetyl coenzyme A synthetase (ADP forming)-like protein